MAINSANYIKGQSLYKESCFLTKENNLRELKTDGPLPVTGGRGGP